MKAFKDIKKGDVIRWESGGMLTGLPVWINEGKAQKLIKADKNDGFVDVWMVNCDGASMPVTPTSFRGFGRRAVVKK